LMTEDAKPLSAARRSVPLYVEAAVTRALAKLPADRFATASEFAEALALRVIERSSDVRFESASATTTRQVAPRRVVLPSWLPWVVAVAGVAVAAAAMVRGRPILPPVAPAFGFIVPVPGGFSMSNGTIATLAISPDGSMLAFASNEGLRIHYLGRFDSEVIPGTERAHTPFFSPDGTALGFVRANMIMRMATGSAAAWRPVKVAEAPGIHGVAWGPNHRIVFSPGLGASGLSSVADGGGAITALTSVSEQRGETNHVWPDVLPDGSLLYTALGVSAHAEDAKLMLQRPNGDPPVVIATGVTFGRYVHAHGGNILYADADGTLLLLPFDLQARKARGPHRPVLSDHVRTSFSGGAVSYVVSLNGTLAYATGTELREAVVMEVDRAGQERRRFETLRDCAFGALSPDEKMLALGCSTARNTDIWLLNLVNGQPKPFTFDLAEEESPVWSPDGKHIAYSAAGAGAKRRLVIKPVGGTDSAKVVQTMSEHFHLISWASNGRWIALDRVSPDARRGAVLDLADSARLTAVGPATASVLGLRFSPDGNWLAYTSTESGRAEVYVVSFPGLGQKRQISRDGGSGSQWARHGMELYWIDRPGSPAAPTILAARRSSVASTDWSEPVKLFRFTRSGGFLVAGDGQRFYLMAPNEENRAREIRVVENWIDEVFASDPKPRAASRRE
jgi:eukaryotic-like serine/threonine-protein kinase